MAPFHHSSVRSRIVVTMGASLLLTIGAVQAGAGQIRITAVSNATLRAAPDAGADVVAQIPLGTQVVEAGPAGLDKTWVRVRLPDTREGWVLARLTRPFDREWPWPTFDAIIAARLARTGDGFPAATELVAFIERIAPEYTNDEGRAGIELARLRAISAALRSIPFGGGRREPYASWLAARIGEVGYDEPGGRWIMRHDELWQLHARYAATTSADDIAWFAVTNGLPGECEGYLACYLHVRNLLHGEYLRGHPDGRHAAEVLAVVNRTAELLLAPERPHQAWQFEKARDCGEFRPALDALTAAARETRVAGRAEALANLEKLAAFCR